jgi:acyl-CoA synthetase (AMP-forming)/AMP-acid ligase II
LSERSAGAPNRTARRTTGLLGILDDPARLTPDRAALIVDGMVTTYAELAYQLNSAASVLAREGVRPGDRVALADDAGVAPVAATLALVRLGASAALMNPRLTADELGTLAGAAGVGSVAVGGPRYVERLARVPGLSVLPSDTLMSDTSPPVPSVEPAEPPVASEADAMVLFTSGTTGTPKAIPLSRRSIDRRIATFAPVFDPLAAARVAIMCVPLVHIGGMLGLLVSLSRGDTTVLQVRFDAGEWLALVQRHRVNSAFLVPTMLHRVLDHPDFDSFDLSSLELVSYGAAPASVELVTRALAAFPKAQFSNVFGQTETLGSITALGPDDHRAGAAHRLASVGRPMPGVAVRIVDPATGVDIASGEVGELWVKPQAAATLEPVGDDGLAAPPGWLRTGDLMHQDVDGYLYPEGRISETINRGGEKFAPGEVEDVLLSHPAVSDVAVAGIPDLEMGHRVGAAVVAVGPVDAGELKLFCRERLANFKIPEVVAFVDAIPYNDFGKVSRRALAERISERPGTTDSAE